MFTPTVIPGPPGTGKTSRLVALVRDEIDRGVPACELAYVTFSRAAAESGTVRVWEATGLAANDTLWFRTLHSACREILGTPTNKLVTDARWSEFAKLHGYKFTSTDESDDDTRRRLPMRTPGDQLRFAYDWGRNCRLTPDETLQRWRGPRIRHPVFAAFIRRFEEFKAQHGLRDFTDLLEDALDRDTWPKIRVAFIDEAQDLSPLQIAIVERWFAMCERAYVAGDDDQAIYIHNGADPAWFCQLAERCPVERLTVSRRLPRVIHEFAGRLIAKNELRVEKPFEPRAEGGAISVKNPRAAIRELEGAKSAFVLARNRIFLRPYAEALLNAAIPYIVVGKGGRSPYSDSSLMLAAKTAERLHKNPDASISARSLGALLERISNTAYPGRDAAVESVKQLARRGTPVTRAFIEHGLNLRDLLSAIDADPMAPITSTAPWKRRYLARVFAANGTLPDPRITLSSIHGAKGLEADLVVLLSAMTPSTHREYQRGGQRGREAETRVFYVGVTRARQALVIVPSNSRRGFRFPRIEVAHAS